MDTVLVTGANRGLGLEFAKQYAAEGWRVIACSRRSSPALAGLAGLQPEVMLQALDVTDGAQIMKLANELDGEAIDVLVNSAGIMGKTGFGGSGFTEQRFGNIDYEDLEQILRTNLIGPLRMIDAFLPNVGRGHQKKIVTLTSILGSIALNNRGGLYGYRASKAAVNAVTKSMSLDLAGQGMIAVALHPGWVRTDMGGARADIDATESVRGMRRVIAGLTAADAGKVIAWDGQVLPY